MKGHVWKFNNNIDTDVIIPARYLNNINSMELAKHCFIDINKEYVKKVQKGDIIVAGENFGCGSSREHAAIALKYSGIQCIIAKSFARIFYRNAINIGLPVFEIGDSINEFKNNDIIEINGNVIKNIDTGKIIKIKPYPEFIQKILSSGGLINYTIEVTK